MTHNNEQKLLNFFYSHLKRAKIKNKLNRLFFSFILVYHNLSKQNNVTHSTSSLPKETENDAEKFYVIGGYDTYLGILMQIYYLLYIQLNIKV